MKKIIAYETPYGKNKSILKFFNNQRHLDNFVGLLYRHGYLNVEIYNYKKVSNQQK